LGNSLSSSLPTRNEIESAEKVSYKRREMRKILDK
jgi:hypothetical protein